MSEPEAGRPGALVTRAVASLLGALVVAGGYFGYRSIASTEAESAYQQNVRATVEQILTDVTGADVVLAGPDVQWARGPNPMILRVEVGPADALAEAGLAAFRQEVQEHRCSFYDYKPRSTKQYPRYELRIELATGEVLAAEGLEPGDCFCGRPSSDQREICDSRDET